MQTLEERLDPARFFRIHRSAIVRLKSGTQLSVSRSRIEALERWMGVGKNG
ncbi:MAG: LytTR family transcriptional regulator DNA-binding domain-containing protein [Gammaproteobacteria bacterium]